MWISSSYTCVQSPQIESLAPSFLCFFSLHLESSESTSACYLSSICTIALWIQLKPSSDHHAATIMVKRFREHQDIESRKNVRVTALEQCLQDMIWLELHELTTAVVTCIRNIWDWIYHYYIVHGRGLHKDSTFPKAYGFLMVAWGRRCHSLYWCIAHLQ